MRDERKPVFHMEDGNQTSAIRDERRKDFPLFLLLLQEANQSSSVLKKKSEQIRAVVFSKKKIRAVAAP
jgi:hypothetical protein